VNMAGGRTLMFNSYEDQLWPSLMSHCLDTAVNFTEKKRPRRYKRLTAPSIPCHFQLVHTLRM
jgi:hypothetical protein